MMCSEKWDRMCRGSVIGGKCEWHRTCAHSHGFTPCKGSVENFGAVPRCAAHDAEVAEWDESDLAPTNFDPAEAGEEW
jgi:hypothetical protein